MQSQPVQSEALTRHASLAMHSLLAEVIDYAGLFPPASLPLGTAVRNYLAYRQSPNSWLLGRFVVPASRLPELHEVVYEILSATVLDAKWKISALVGKEYLSDFENITGFNRTNSYCAVDAIEAKPELQGNIEQVLAVTPAETAVYFETSLPASLDVLHALKRSGARAKVRTGGVVPESIPQIRDLAEFLVAVVAVGIQFKATAGLHHPIRCFRPLSYEANAPSAEMHGFVNLFTASAMAMSGASVDVLCKILADRDASSFLFTDHELSWKGKSVSVAQIQKAREQFTVSFGSCSFAEPIEDLSAIGWL